MSDDIPKNKKHENTLSDEDRSTWKNFIEGFFIQSDKKEQENFEFLLNQGEVVFDKDQDSFPPQVAELSVEDRIERTKKKNITHDADLQIDKRTFEKLRKGKIPIEKRLDLHGLNQEQAYAALKGFILSCYENNNRLVLIITGKGKPQKMTNNWSMKEDGVLKNKTPIWLSEGYLKPYVLKFLQAQPKDGGSGALYVYLRRNKL